MVLFEALRFVVNICSRLKDTYGNYSWYLIESDQNLSFIIFYSIRSIFFRAGKNKHQLEGLTGAKKTRRRNTLDQERGAAVVIVIFARARFYLYGNNGSGIDYLETRYAWECWTWCCSRSLSLEEDVVTVCRVIGDRKRSSGSRSKLLRCRHSALAEVVKVQVTHSLLILIRPISSTHSIQVDVWLYLRGLSRSLNRVRSERQSHLKV